MSVAERRAALARFVAKLPPDKLAALTQQTKPRVVEPYTTQTPHPKQQVFLNLKEQEVLFGGAAGGGKSSAILMAALQYVDVPGYSALILRRTWADLVLPGAIMDRAATWLANTPAHKLDGGRVWKFPSGARIQFGYLQHENDKLRYQSAEFQFIAFDELTQWPLESAYDYMFSRIRRPTIACVNCSVPMKRVMGWVMRNGAKVPNFRYAHKNASRCTQPYPDPKVLANYKPAPDGTSIFDIPLRMRAGTNPGGPGMEWVRKRFVDPATRRSDARFIRSLLQDNPSLDQEEYRKALHRLNPVDRERLLNGDWDVVESGDMFDRADFRPVTTTPIDCKYWVRYWDLAATSGGGDWTVGALCSVRQDNTFHIEHIVRIQGGPREVENLIKATAQVDTPGVHIRMEQEPGSSGVTVIDHYARNVLSGWNFSGIKTTGDKVTRATALSSYVAGGYVSIKIGRWNGDMLDEMQLFPKGAHDDQVDAVAGAFNYLTQAQRVRIIV
jgi:predicted phage terminase large subunit-like protein